ncbi:MAG: hypothetical protein ACE5EX_10840, partial [Phycisphaerae bacterium]
MKKNEVKVGGFYTAKVSDRLVTVRIDSAHGKGGWNATNTRTGKRIRIKSAQRLRGPAKGGAKTKTSATAQRTPRLDRMPGDVVAAAARHNQRKAGEGATDAKSPRAKRNARPQAGKARATDGKPKPKRVSALDAAAQVLKSAGKPMRAQELIAA